LLDEHRSTLLDEGLHTKSRCGFFYTKAQNVTLVFCNQNNMLPQGEIEEHGSR
jgi:hypothetical protein